MKYHYSIHERYFKCMCCVQVSFSKKKHTNRVKESKKKISLESHRIQLNGCSCILWCKQRLMVIHLKPINWCCTHLWNGIVFQFHCKHIELRLSLKTIFILQKINETYVEHKNVSNFFLLFDLDIIQWNSLIWQHFK